MFIAQGLLWRNFIIISDRECLKLYKTGLCFHSQQKELDVKSICLCAFTFRQTNKTSRKYTFALFLFSIHKCNSICYLSQTVWYIIVNLNDSLTKYDIWYCVLEWSKARARRPYWNLPRLISALGYLCWRRLCDSPGTSLWVFYMPQIMFIELNLHSIWNIPFKSQESHVKVKHFSDFVFAFLSLQLNMLKLGPTVWCQYYVIKPQWRKKNFMK